MIIRRRAVVVVALSVMIFTATMSVLVGLGEAPASFAASEGYVVTSAGAPTIFSSRVEMDMVQALEQMDTVTGVSPEVFAFSSWDGRSFVVRGVEFDRLPSVGPDIETTVSMESFGSSVGHALLGCRLADRMGLDLPSIIPLAGSYSSTVEVVLVGGTFSSDSSLDDEMLVTIEVARRLVGMDPDEASVIRVATSEPAWLESLLAPEEARFTIYDLSCSGSMLVPGAECTVSVDVRNWGSAPGSVTVSFARNGSTFSEQEVSLDGSASTTVSAAFNSTLLGEHNITAAISGDFPVTLSTSVKVVEPYVAASFPGTVLQGSYLEVQVVTFTGGPAPGIEVTLDDASPSSNTTDEAGKCRLAADEAGTFHLLFDLSGTEFEGMHVDGSERDVEVVDLSSFPYAFLPSVTSLAMNPESVKEGESTTVVLTVENGGSLPGVTDVDVMVDSGLFCTLQVSLAPAEGTVVSCELDGLAPGFHTVQAGDFSGLVEVLTWYADDPDLVELVIRYGGSNTLSSAGALPIYQAAKISEGNIALTLFALGTIAALLATMAIVSVYSKEILDARKKLGILRALGASRMYVRRLVFPQALGAAFAGSVIGIVCGLAATSVLVGSGAFMVFGHLLEFSAGMELVLPILGGAVAISLVSALSSAELAVRETAMSSMRELPDEGDEGTEEEGPLMPSGE